MWHCSIPGLHRRIHDFLLILKPHLSDLCMAVAVVGRLQCQRRKYHGSQHGATRLPVVRRWIWSVLKHVTMSYDVPVTPRHSNTLRPPRGVVNSSWESSALAKILGTSGYHVPAQLAQRFEANAREVQD